VFPFGWILKAGPGVVVGGVTVVVVAVIVEDGRTTVEVVGTSELMRVIVVLAILVLEPVTSTDET